MEGGGTRRWRSGEEWTRKQEMRGKWTGKKRLGKASPGAEIKDAQVQGMESQPTWEMRRRRGRAEMRQAWCAEDAGCCGLVDFILRAVDAPELLGYCW